MPEMLWTWEQGITRSGLEPTTRLLLFTLATYMDKHGKSCFPSIPEICEASGLKERTVSKHIKIAKEAGWIIVSKRRQAGKKWDHNFYEASWPKRGAPDAGVHQTTKRGAPDAGYHSKNNPKDRYPVPHDWIPKPEFLKECIETGFTNDEIEDIIAGFIDYWTGEAKTRAGKKSERGWNAAFRNRINSLEKQWSVRHRKRSKTASTAYTGGGQRQSESLGETASRMARDGQV